MRALTMIAVAGALAVAGPVRAQAPAVTVSVTGRMQFQLNSTSVDGGDIGEPLASTSFETRRVRLGVSVLVGDWIRGYIEPEYALARLSLRQVWMSFEVDSAFVIRAGQFKKPFSLINLASSTAHPMIERGVRIRGLEEMLALKSTGELSAVRGALLVGEQHTLLETQGYLGYDMGVAIEGRRGGLGWSAGLFNGAGPDRRDENNGKSLAGRLTWTVDVGTPLTFGGAWSRRELNWPTADDATTRTGDAFEVDAELGGLRRGWWLLAEVSSGTNLATEERFLGAQAVVSRFFGTGGARVEGFEPMARVSWGDPDDAVEDDAGLLLTPGLNLYFVGRNRLMLNWDVFVPEGSAFDTQHAGRAQVNLYF